MAKNIIFYLNGKDIATFPVTQNEIGVYYWNGSSYYKPVLSQFDNAVLPSGYKTYANGSHEKYKSNPLRHPLDISVLPEYVLTCNKDFVRRGATSADDSWMKGSVVGSSAMIGLVHTYKWGSSTIQAGQPICRIAPKSVTGFASHLHIDEWSGYKIRDLILTGDFEMSEVLKIGDKVKIIGGDMNLRKGAGTGFGYVTGKELALKEGAVVQIKDGIRTSQNSLFYGKGSTIKENDNYQWIDIKDREGRSGWIAITNRVQKVHGNTALTNIDGTIPQPPVIEPPVVEPPIDPELVELRKKVIELTKVKETLESDKADLNKEIEGLNGTIDEWIEKYKEQTIDLNQALGYKKYQKLYMDAVEDLRIERSKTLLERILEMLFPKKS